jgi:hypothetical protein
MKGWYIRTTEENQKVVLEWYCSKYGGKPREHDHTFGNYHGTDIRGNEIGKMYTTDINDEHPNCKELTFDEFRHLILKETSISKDKNKNYNYLTSIIEQINKHYAKLETKSR